MRSAAAWLLVCAAACGGEPSRAPSPARLPPGVAAMVGDDAIELETVARIARAQRLPAREARDRAIADALLAAEASERGLPGAARSARRSALARALLERIRDEAVAQGPVTDAEIDRLTRRHWLDFDRPRAVRVIHAAALVKKREQEGPAEALAKRVREAVQGVKSAEEFQQRAEAVERGGIELVVERLTPVAADGKQVWTDERPPPGTPDQYYVKEFGAAAARLQQPLDITPVFPTYFGWHVAMAIEVFPEKRVPLDERRKALSDEAIGDRMKALEEPLLEKLRGEWPVQLDRAAAQLTALVDVAR
jgi:peptidyl-prolyl cis-trans isomerase C